MLVEQQHQQLEMDYESNDKGKNQIDTSQVESSQVQRNFLPLTFDEFALLLSYGFVIHPKHIYSMFKKEDYVFSKLHRNKGRIYLSKKYDTHWEILLQLDVKTLNINQVFPFSYCKAICVDSQALDKEGWQVQMNNTRNADLIASCDVEFVSRDIYSGSTSCGPKSNKYDSEEFMAIKNLSSLLGGLRLSSILSKRLFLQGRVPYVDIPRLGRFFEIMTSPDGDNKKYKWYSKFFQNSELPGIDKSEPAELYKLGVMKKICNDDVQDLWNKINEFHQQTALKHHLDSLEEKMEKGEIRDAFEYFKEFHLQPDRFIWFCMLLKKFPNIKNRVSSDKQSAFETVYDFYNEGLMEENLAYELTFLLGVYVGFASLSEIKILPSRIYNEQSEWYSSDLEKGLRFDYDEFHLLYSAVKKILSPKSILTFKESNRQVTLPDKSYNSLHGHSRTLVIENLRYVLKDDLLVYMRGFLHKKSYKAESVLKLCYEIVSDEGADDKSKEVVLELFENEQGGNILPKLVSMLRDGTLYQCTSLIKRWESRRFKSKK